MIKKIFTKLLLRINRVLYVENQKLRKNRIVIDLLNENAAKMAANYIGERLSTSLIFNGKRELWDFVIEKLDRDNNYGVCLEFGVYKGASLNYFASKLRKCQFFGFDSFLGLSTDWVGTSHGAGSYTAQIPVHLPQNVELISGFFDTSLPKFALRSDVNWGDIKFVHVDCDTYDATSEVLNLLGNIEEFDFLILFDDFFEGVCWWEGQKKAFHEWQKEKEVNSVPLGFSSQQALFRVRRGL